MYSSNNMIVVTGGAGLIGSGVIRALNDQGNKDIVVVDNLGNSLKWKNLVGKSFLHILHKDELFQWLKGREKGISAIIHLGACSSTVEDNANYLLSNNYQYSVELAKYAIPAGIRFIYASSAATYGDGKQGFCDSTDHLETLSPLNMYGYSKHLFDLWLKNHHLLDKVVGLKYFNVYGPNEYHKGRMSSAVLKMVPQALSTGKLQLFKSNDPDHFKDGEQVRDFIYVKDAARMTIQFLNNHLTGLFNIGTGKAESWRKLAEAVIDSLNAPVEMEYIDMPPDLKPIYQNYTCSDVTKYTEEKLLKPIYSLEQGVKEYVRDYILEKNYW